ncbi:hypothetical protein Pyn_23315 [Prunus yedoensis var. nudiflora]|uniref:Uncharacterized protein n=1 Tax=Prunus yedoensis var. nudiflora TaxID=2094558 RepID=A0A315AEU6_PRUYE|nr:hypothetical protein Pyn_23315 [Prunus yedoensis var. nudiflora]
MACTKNQSLVSFSGTAEDVESQNAPFGLDGDNARVVTSLPFGKEARLMMHSFGQSSDDLGTGAEIQRQRKEAYVDVEFALTFVDI